MAAKKSSAKPRPKARTAATKASPSANNTRHSMRIQFEVISFLVLSLIFLLQVIMRYT